jgi:hypothetical protein
VDKKQAKSEKQAKKYLKKKEKQAKKSKQKIYQKHCTYIYTKETERQLVTPPLATKENKKKITLQ